MFFLFGLKLFRGNFPGGLEGKVSAWNAGDPGSTPGLGRFPSRRIWQPTPVLLPGKSRGWKSLVGYSPWGRRKSDMTERLHFTFSKNCCCCSVAKSCLTFCYPMKFSTPGFTISQSLLKLMSMRITEAYQSFSESRLNRRKNRKAMSWVGFRGGTGHWESRSRGN